MGIGANLKVQFSSRTDGWRMPRACPARLGYKHDTREILEEKIASNTAVQLDISNFAVPRGRGSHSLGLDFLAPCVTSE